VCTAGLARDWKERLGALARDASDCLLVASPYISVEGASFLRDAVHHAFRRRGVLTILTDLSPINVCAHATEPAAIYDLASSVGVTNTWHLPCLHAKVYVADDVRAIVTSANLTTGGLSRNYEYGLEVTDRGLVAQIRDDLHEYAQLGGNMPLQRLADYAVIADRVKHAFAKQRRTIAAAARREFERGIREAEDELIRLRLAGGAPHTVFAKTILYLLRRCGSMRTVEMHPRISAIHPDLCDDSIDRVIDGKRFGKKWKHAVRTAQQYLKRTGMVTYDKGAWRLVRESDAREGR
jgi:hypothetical protein